CPEDVAEARRLGVSTDRILQLPYALTDEEHDCLRGIPPASPKSNRILFLGTFDWRKGAADMPKIFERILETEPGASLRLAGTQGLFRTEHEVRTHFPRNIQNKLEVIPRFVREELPTMLRDCTAGIFPSYLEGWGFAVTEQMAAGVPVVVYDAPGVSMQLPRDFLVKAGDWRGMADKVATLLKNPEKRANASVVQREIADSFVWDPIIKATDRAYRERMARLRSA
ncbi:MAG: glycosyltransferase family 4 protein, partial [Chthoniobacteraceae bacterium]